MTKDELLNTHIDEEFLFADGFDECIIGLDPICNRIVYSIPKCLEKLEAEGMGRQEAIEFFYFNTIHAYVGELTPIWCDTTIRHE